MQHSSDVLAAGAIALLGYDHDRRAQVPAGQTLVVTLFWRCEQPVDVAYTVFVHLLDGDQRVWAQHDAMPASGEAPTSGWVTGQVVPDAHILDIPADAPAGPYEIEVGLYDASTGVRAPLLMGLARICPTTASSSARSR